MDMFLVNRAIQYPGHDLHGQQTGPCIDTGVNIRAYGRVYLSVSEVKVAARLLDFGSPERAAEYEATMEAQVERIAELEAEVEAMRPVYDAFRALNPTLATVPTPAAA